MMKHVVRIKGTYPIDVIVEPTETAVRLVIQFLDDKLTLLPSPAEAIRLSTALYDAAWPLVEAKRGAQERGPS